MENTDTELLPFWYWTASTRESSRAREGKSQRPRRWKTLLRDAEQSSIPSCSP